MRSPSTWDFIVGMAEIGCIAVAALVVTMLIVSWSHRDRPPSDKL